MGVAVGETAGAGVAVGDVRGVGAGCVWAEIPEKEANKRAIKRMGL